MSVAEIVSTVFEMSKGRPEKLALFVNKKKVVCL
jgi:hypothetical protein